MFCEALHAKCAKIMEVFNSCSIIAPTEAVDLKDAMQTHREALALTSLWKSHESPSKPL